MLSAVIVKLYGEPVVDGTRIQFAGKGVINGLGVTKSGEYVLSNLGSPEIPAGEYSIQILPPERPKAEEEAETKKLKELMVEAAANSLAKKPLPVIPPSVQVDLIPRKYWSEATSNLKFSVKTGDNTADFELTKKENTK